jgi:uncharacterized protein (TIGR02246 family)
MDGDPERRRTTVTGRSAGVAALATALGLAIACESGGGDDVTAARAEIERLAHQWEEAANTAQVEGLVEIYAPDAVILPPGGPSIEGSATIRELFRQEFDQFDTKIAFTTQAIEVEGNMAYRRGRYVWRGTPRGSGQQTFETTNKFLEVWKRQPDGTWRLTVDIWNAAEQPTAAGGVGVSTTPEDAPAADGP